MKIRLIKEKELESLKEIDKEYYGSETPLETLEDWFEAFPEGFFVAEGEGKIVAYIFVELLDKPEILPFIHKATLTHKKNGKYMNVSGLGVLDIKNTAIGERLLDKVIELADSKDYKQILFITGESAEGHDSYERKIISRKGFVKKMKIDRWEAYPGFFVSDHWLWINEPLKTLVDLREAIIKFPQNNIKPKKKKIILT